jgi:hypothetical protein
MIDTDLTLEEAQQHYGRSLVPWVLDSKDLSIINRIRRQYMTQYGTLLIGARRISGLYGTQESHKIPEIESAIHGALWTAAQG